MQLCVSARKSMSAYFSLIGQQNECVRADLHPGNLLVRVVGPNST